MQKWKLAMLMAALLFFGCVQPSQPVQPAKTLAQELDIPSPAPHSAFYYANVSSIEGNFQGTLATYYTYGNFHADVQFAGMDGFSLFRINGSNYLCLQAQGTCTMQSEGASGFGLLLLQSASSFSVETLPQRKIANQDAKCFSISPKGGTQYFSSINCYSPQGVLVYSFSSDLAQGTTMETTLTGAGGTPSEARFRLPYPMQ